MSDSSGKHPVLALSPSGNAVFGFARPAAQPVGHTSRHDNNKEGMMGKYFLGWLLGVPAVVLVLIYFFMN
jgi:hypothetical protein